jgi:tellurite methyltransferase
MARESEPELSNEERQAWDERFRSGDHTDETPDPFLLQLDQYRELFLAGRRALDLACGAGRNAIWLAQTGWQVTCCDLSLEGLRRAKALSASRDLRVNLICMDLDNASLPENSFDLIICFFFLQRTLFPTMKRALREHGLIVYKTYTTDQQRFPGRPRHATHMLRPQELLQEFRDFRVLFYEELVEGKGVAQLIAQKKSGPGSAVKMTLPP